MMVYAMSCRKSAAACRWNGLSCLVAQSSTRSSKPEMITQLCPRWSACSSCSTIVDCQSMMRDRSSSGRSSSSIGLLR